MATYDQAGNEIPEGKAVYPTQDPNIVKMPVHDGEPLPQYATTADINGQRWAYFPTDAALRMGKIMAAFDTLSEVPAQVEAQLTEAARVARDTVSGIPNFVLWLGAGLIVLELLARRR